MALKHAHTNKEGPHKGQKKKTMHLRLKERENGVVVFFIYQEGKISGKNIDFLEQ